MESALSNICHANNKHILDCWPFFLFQSVTLIAFQSGVLSAHTHRAHLHYHFLRFQTEGRVISAFRLVSYPKYKQVLLKKARKEILPYTMKNRVSINLQFITARTKTDIKRTDNAEV